MTRSVKGVNRAIDLLAMSTEVSFSATSQVRKAFILGLWHKSFPDYMFGHLDSLYSWDLQEIVGEKSREMIGSLDGFKFQFISDTGDSWHQNYRDLRKLGWQRLGVHRDGGRLSYLFSLEDSGTITTHEDGDVVVYEKPEGYRQLYLLLDISISTCQQVQVGTETKEIPIYKTVCDDLVDVKDDEAERESKSAEVTNLVVIDDVETLVITEHPTPDKDDGIPF